MSPARPFDDPRLPARRPVRRIGDLLPDAARELGLAEQLRWALAGVAWDAVIAAVVPGAAGGSRPVRIEGHATLVVEVVAPVVGQELRIRAEEILDAFGEQPGGMRAERLRVVVGRGMIRSP